jgi:hypothetical protein
MQRATRRAAEIGKPFNRFITLHLQKGGVDERETAAATRAFLKLAADWLRHKGGRLCWIYSLEWGRHHGAHAHILLHVPAALDGSFRRMPKRWATTVLPLGYVKSAVLSKRIRGANTPDEVSAALYEKELWEDVHYLMKAAPAELEEPLGMRGRGRSDVRWGQSSLVYGKRSGTWQERKPLYARGGKL